MPDPTPDLRLADQAIDATDHVLNVMAELRLQVSALSEALAKTPSIVQIKAAVTQVINEQDVATETQANSNRQDVCNCVESAKGGTE